ncbi:MAG: UDP-N-acetylglucosamine 2-epimerase (non-hydrolyzing) [Verrucomicrobia bacterium]|nr:UDP-N-acetylglucosamine 2-epimerase (non-hydrolyzing) [Verrucomicrobiota bacterium]MDA1087811.1 UDP-N-acetylglucosamine 2-epimerase (non-hydrolyzing) [Verrucomicrobiota bacterium]
MRVMPVAGARPNFMKIAPLMHALQARGETFETHLVHTGQHYDEAMSESFFKTLSIPDPDENLGIGSGTHGEQVGRTMIAFEKVLERWRPDWVVVVGDVNATCACSITARKLGIRVAHIEAGLRSFDLSMPEEINRMVTDRLSDLLFTTDALADRNLATEGVPAERIHRVGNVMIDSLEAHRDAASKLNLSEVIGASLLAASAGPELEDGAYAVLTLHRPSNVDSRDVLQALVRYIVDEFSSERPVVWPVHPRTRARMEEFGLWEDVVQSDRVHLTAPLGYHAMLRLNMRAALMLTDSGGLQEECCVLGVPCVTLRENTERPITLVEHGGASLLAGNNVERIRGACKQLLASPPAASRPPLWDGHAAQRIADVLCAFEE